MSEILSDISWLPAGLIFALAWVTPVWLWSVVKKDASIIDIFWGAGFVAIAGFYAVQGSLSLRALLLLTLVAVWGLRLTIYIAVRNHGKGEDPRYRAMREARNPGFWWKSLPLVFWLQGGILWLVSAPLAHFFHPEAPREPTALDAVAFVLFAVGLTFEALGDAQLARFKADPANSGQVMDRGLWRYTRHPNYFGDFTIWWSFFLFACGTPGAWWTIVSPLAMSFLLMNVSGVALLEKGLTDSKPKYADYIRRTNAFFPWKPSPRDE